VNGLDRKKICEADNILASTDTEPSPLTGDLMMPKLALFVRLEAKPGKEADVVKFLETGLTLVRQEPTTPIWFALRLSTSSFGIFDAFHDEDDRGRHLSGPIAQALTAAAPELCSRPPTIESIDVLGLKNRLQPS
jgi:quinol monooxygenase YgiN